MVLSAAFAYVLKREAFGKVLFEQPVVRHRLAKAGVLLESLSAWVEQFVYQLTIMKKEEADIELGGLTAAAKAHAGMVLKECADCAAILFGGNGYTRTGQGEIAERMWREVNGNRVPGGVSKPHSLAQPFHVLIIHRARMSCWTSWSASLGRTSSVRLKSWRSPKGLSFEKVSQVETSHRQD